MCFGADIGNKRQNKEDLKRYDEEILALGIEKERIRHYGFAFEGKKVLIGRWTYGGKKNELTDKYKSS